MDFAAGPNGQELASIELDYYVGIAPTLGKWTFDIAAYYVAYPAAFDPDGEFNDVEIWTGITRSFFDDKLELTIYNYWSPEFSARPATMTCSNSLPSGPSTRSAISHRNSAAKLAINGAI